MDNCFPDVITTFLGQRGKLLDRVAGIRNIKMNIFILSKSRRRRASYLADKHVVKMILENDREFLLYKATHVNHPCAIWVRANYKWMYKNFLATCQEYTFRYSKIHKCERLLSSTLCEIPKNIPQSESITEPPQCVPDQYKSKCVVEAYRNYYRIDKKHLAKWTKRKTPHWWQDLIPEK